MILQEALEAVRKLNDEAVLDGELRHATALSKLSSALEYAVAKQSRIHTHSVSRADVEQEIGSLIAQLATKLPSVAGLLLAAIPATASEPANIERLRVELGQVKTLFDLAVEGKSVGDVARLAHLLIIKSKALTRSQIDAGLLITADEFAAIRQPIFDTVDMARDLVGPAEFDAAVDAFQRENLNG